MLRNLLCKDIIHDATQIGGLCVVQTVRTICLMRHHLNIGADPIRVCQSLSAEQLRPILGRREVL